MREHDATYMTDRQGTLRLCIPVPVDSSHVGIHNVCAMRKRVANSIVNSARTTSQPATVKPRLDFIAVPVATSRTLMLWKQLTTYNSLSTPTSPAV